MIEARTSVQACASASGVRAARACSRVGSQRVTVRHFSNRHSQVGSRTGARTVGRGFPAALFRLCRGVTIPPWSRFQLPPRQTQHADFPHCAFLPASSQGLCDLFDWERFRSRPTPPLSVLVGLRLGVYPPPPALQTAGRFSQGTSAARVWEELRTVGSLGSTGTTLLPCYYGPSRHPLVFRRFPSGCRLYDVPSAIDFAMGRGGLLQLLDASWSPCCRSRPAGVPRRVSQYASCHAAFTSPLEVRPPGLRTFGGTTAFTCVTAR